VTYTYSVHKHVNKFALATIFVVALMTLLCSATPSHAEVVYTDIYVFIENKGTYNFDFDNDGFTDLTFSLILSQNNCPNTIVGVEQPASGNGAVITPLEEGASIGPGLRFYPRAHRMASLKDTCPGWTYSGPWPENQTRYLGVSFLIDGETHYAWASVEFEVITTFGPPKLVAKLTGYAYETVAGMPISAGQTQ